MMLHFAGYDVSKATLDIVYGCPYSGRCKRPARFVNT